MHSAPRFPSQTPQMKNAGSILPAFHTTRAKLSNLLSQKAISFPSIDYPGSVQRKLYPIENITSIAKGSSRETRKHVSIILRATRQKVKCIMEYQVPNKEATLTAEISPVFSFFYDGGMYLQALLDDGSLRTYAIERIREISIIRNSQALAPDFDPKVLLSDPFGPFIGRVRIDAEVRIAPEQVAYVKERKWPDGIEIEDNKDGSATFRVTTYGEHEFTNWLLSQKASAELLEPGWLRSKIAATINDMNALYSSQMDNQPS